MELCGQLVQIHLQVRRPSPLLKRPQERVPLVAFPVREDADRRAEHLVRRDKDAQRLCPADCHVQSPPLKQEGKVRR